MTTWGGGGSSGGGGAAPRHPGPAHTPQSQSTRRSRSHPQGMAHAGGSHTPRAGVKAWLRGGRAWALAFFFLRSSNMAAGSRVSGSPRVVGFAGGCVGGCACKLSSCRNTAGQMGGSLLRKVSSKGLVQAVFNTAKDAREISEKRVQLCFNPSPPPFPSPSNFRAWPTSCSTPSTRLRHRVARFSVASGAVVGQFGVLTRFLE